MAWLAWRSIRMDGRAAIRGLFAAIGVAGVAASIFGGVRLSRPAHLGPIAWTYYTPQRFTDALDDGRVVLLEFTAEWCLNCKALEESVLRSSRVVDRLNGDGVVPMKVDLTGNNIAGKGMLSDVGWVGIPLLVIFKPDGTEVFKEDFYTPEMVIDKIAEASALKVASN